MNMDLPHIVYSISITCLAMVCNWTLRDRETSNLHFHAIINVLVVGMLFFSQNRCYHVFELLCPCVSEPARSWILHVVVGHLVEPP